MPSRYWDKPCPCGEGTVTWGFYDAGAYDRQKLRDGDRPLEPVVNCPECQQTHSVLQWESENDWGPNSFGFVVESNEKAEELLARDPTLRTTYRRI
jgi:hypothetical protein